MSDPSDPPGRILLLTGGDLGSAHSLLGAITHPAAPAPLASPARDHPWQLDTKYYRADVLFELRHVEQCAELQLQDGLYEAVLMVFDPKQQASFASLQRWWEAAGGDDADLGVRLAVALADPAGISGGLACPPWLAEAEQWCADQLVEFVEAAAATHAAEDEEPAAAAAAAAAAPAALAGHSSEATGVARIQEALQAHMWPGMQLKTGPQRGMAADAAAAHGQGGAEAEVEDAVPAGTPGGSQSAAAAEAGEDGAGFVEFSFRDYLQGPAQEPAPAAGAQPGAAAEGEGEQEMEDLERMFAQVTSQRDQLAQLPDAQRREAAAAMVMRLMAAMGLEEDADALGEEDSEEEEE